MHLLVPVKSQGKSCQSIVTANHVISCDCCLQNTNTHCSSERYARMDAINQLGLSRDQSDSSSMLVRAAVQKRTHAYHDRSVIA